LSRLLSKTTPATNFCLPTVWINGIEYLFAGVSKMSGVEASKTVSWKAWEGSVVEGKFPLKQWLGSSDHSAVFLTEHASQKAAIKLVAADAADPDQLSRWQSAAQLSHPNLIRIFASGRSQVDGVPVLYVVMENADDNLGQLLPERPLAAEEAADLLPPLLDALSYLHDKGFVHGRIQPSNILAVGDRLKLSSDQLVSPEAANGNRRRRDLYDAPETAAGIISPAGDLWSVGVTLVAALTQNVAFVGEAEQGGPKLPTTIPEPFRGIARECLHLDPRRRCSIAEIKARLQPGGRSVPAPAELPAKKVATANHFKITWRILIPPAVLLVFALTWGLFHRSATPTAVSLKQDGDIKFATTQPPEGTKPVTSTDSRSPKVSPQGVPSSPSAAENKSADSPGAVLHQVLPDIPPSARNTITGTIKISVRVDVDSSGKVTNARLTHAGPSNYFARLASQAAHQWQFAPPQENGQSTASVWMIQFRLRRSGTQASSERQKH
jgi:TonB family protein